MEIQICNSKIRQKNSMKITPQKTYNHPKDKNTWSTEEHALINKAMDAIPEGTPLDVRTVVPRVATYPKPIIITKERISIKDLKDSDGRAFFEHSNDFGYKLMGELAKEKNRWHSIPSGVTLEQIIDRFYNAYERTVPFMFNSSINLNYNTEAKQGIDKWSLPNIDLILTVDPEVANNIAAEIIKAGTPLDSLIELPVSLPFPVCSFETIHNAIIKVTNGKLDNDFEIFNNIQCILISETTPDLVDLFILEQQERYKFQYIPNIPVRCDHKTTYWSWLVSMLTHYINRVSIKVGTEQINQKIKIGTGKNKRFHKIKEIVRIVSKKEQIHATPIVGHSIDWTHRFSVRGHWREIKGIGHDRSGNPIKGVTWVNTYVKGPKDKPLLDKKIRVMENDPSL